MARKTQKAVQQKQQPKPKLFIGSSSEGIQIANYLQLCLRSVCDVTVWNQGVFGVGQQILNSLIDAAKTHDFAVLVLTPDDRLISRNKQYAAARDNVIFELGLFIGALGQDRTFIVHREDSPPKIPTDLSGIVTARYDNSSSLQAAVSPACIHIMEAVNKALLRGSPRERCYQLLSGMVSRYPNPIREVDLDMFLDYELIGRSHYSVLRDALQGKLSQSS